MRKLSVKLFSESALNGQVKLTQEEADLLDRMIISGVYGTEDLYIENNFKKISGDKEGSSKLKYAMYRLFPCGRALQKNLSVLLQAQGGKTVPGFCQRL